MEDADLHLREACAETVFRLTRSLVVDATPATLLAAASSAICMWTSQADGSPVFATLLKPLFGALTEHNKSVGGLRKGPIPVGSWFTFIFSTYFTHFHAFS